MNTTPSKTPTMPIEEHALPRRQFLRQSRLALALGLPLPGLTWAQAQNQPQADRTLVANIVPEPQSLEIGRAHV